MQIEDFLRPISDTNECGKYLRYDYDYDQIQEYRREDDADLSQGIWQTENKKANWPEVKQICSKLLQEQTKDLQIAVWLTESLTVLDGFKGLNSGTLLIKDLCEKFWDNIFPTIDKKTKDISYRLAPFYFFIEKIRDRVVLIPITNPIDGSSGFYSISDWMTARHNIKIKNTKGLSLKQIKKSVLSTSMDFFKTLEADVSTLIDSIKSLDGFLTEKCGKDAPSFGVMLECFDDIHHTTLQNIAEKETQMAEQSKQNTVKEKIIPDETAPAPEPEKKSNATIEHAYEALQEISIFLEKEQPQSPASTLIKIANAIGKKTFQELLEINMKSGASVMSTISELYKVLGTASEDK